jgi:hypothetical protein
LVYLRGWSRSGSAAILNNMNTQRRSLGFHKFSTTMVGVTNPDPDWTRLARHVAQRRTQLGLTQSQVQAAGGPSSATIRNIEPVTQTNYRKDILASLERALRWPPGAVDRILAGDEPHPTGQPTPAENVDLAQYEVRLIEIRDNPDRSPGIRAWAAGLVEQIARLYAAVDDEARRAS